MLGPRHREPVVMRSSVEGPRPAVEGTLALPELEAR